MRIAGLAFAGVLAASAALATPGLTNTASLSPHANANAQATDEQAADPKGCHAYQKGPDGSWVEMACHEGGESATVPNRRKAANH